MILTPFQAIATVVLTVILAGAVMALIHQHMPPSNKTIRRIRDQVDQTHPLYQMTLERIDQTENRLRHLEQPKGLKPANDDPMALWDAIVNDAQQRNQDQA